MTDIRPRRSALLVPATATALAAARSEPADALILDLADSLPPADKEAGRTRLAACLREGGFAAGELVVRLNGLDTPWGEADLAAVAEAGPDAVLVPRVEEPEDLAGIGSRLRRLHAPERTRLWASLDTPLGILAAEAVASAVRDVDARLACLVVDAGALAREGRLPPGAPEAGPLLTWLATALAAARAHDLDVLLDPADRLDIGRARGLGFDGAVVTAPTGARRAEAAFAPDPEALAVAKALVAAFDAPEGRGQAGIAHLGRTVLRREADEARRLVALAEAVASRTGRGA
ncbi:aldolase/citrate lyase family protein [Methylobacterium frigidaeris]|uniref:(3S)-malyl-CoA thioesterase n=1 Tax=Methylobacterium frigidaeris TaxID=2038277 RepID=A0AA37H630_9HYPH|nr:aldolase/citrate lyase family protein [Methylobacterium frigidaeris]PIK69411.1 CoA ester lyase [Methylobacterium frigidaeris]GJD60050.1 (3S)-malyl-CoA thioesterase [Methylobacterium frigidaeris]